MQQELRDTTIPAIFVSHKRGLDVIHPRSALLKIRNVIDKATASKYISNAVLFTYMDKKGQQVMNSGVITRVHGHSGVVRATFERNLCPKSIGQIVLVKLYKL